MTSWPDLFVIKQFLDHLECDRIVAEMKAVEGSAATIYGRGTSSAVDERVRKAVRVRPANETVEFITNRLLATRHSVEKHFGVNLNECEEPQFLRYREGDFFVAHQDGNTGLTRLDSECRLVSTVVFLSRESDSPAPGVHCGGSLVFMNLDSRFHLSGEPGTLVAFRSETTHEVTPVTHGERYSIASWYR